ncbi:hypothetical protein F5887DRAFT_1083144 [Amanita rubescens]|nr:hypothetical protein F5887DRAFT_1083144 [Amanita rubescens]
MSSQPLVPSPSAEQPSVASVATGSALVHPASPISGRLHPFTGRPLEEHLRSYPESQPTFTPPSDEDSINSVQAVTIVSGRLRPFSGNLSDVPSSSPQLRGMKDSNVVASPAVKPRSKATRMSRTKTKGAKPTTRRKTTKNSDSGVVPTRNPPEGEIPERPVQVDTAFHLIGPR